MNSDVDGDTGAHAVEEGGVRPLQRHGVVGEVLPEIVDVAHAPGGHDVVVDGADLGRGVGVLDGLDHVGGSLRVGLLLGDRS